MLRIPLLFSLLFFTQSLVAQVNGGDQMLSFLLVAQGPHASSLGGVVVVNPSADVMLSCANPALLRPEFHQTLSVNHNFYYAGTRLSHLNYAFYHEKSQTTFGMGLTYMNYGELNQMNDIGQTLGSFQSADYMLSLSASRSYLTRWRYGATLKYAHSRLLLQKASALMADIGIVYADTLNAWYLGAVIKNAGVALRHYNPSAPAPLPFDLQIGVMKKFKKAPFAFSVTGHHLYRWDIRYNNPADRVNNSLFGDSSQLQNKTNFGDKLFRHLVFALDMRLGKRLELSAGYNHLRRSELAITERKGLSGYALGIGLYLNKMNLHVAQSYYHVAGPYTEIGLSLNVNQWFGLGKLGNKINWSSQFAKQYP